MKQQFISRLKRLVLATTFAFAAISTVGAVPLDKTMTPATLEQFCVALGYVYASTGDNGLCTNLNCNGQGGTCTIECTAAGRCEGEAPGTVISSMSPVRVLKNLYNPMVDDAAKFTSQGSGGDDDDDSEEPSEEDPDGGECGDGEC